jgi:hypothetical protein
VYNDVRYRRPSTATCVKVKGQGKKGIQKDRSQYGLSSIRHIYLCVCVCVCVCMYVCVPSDMYVCIYVCTYVECM